VIAWNPENVGDAVSFQVLDDGLSASGHEVFRGADLAAQSSANGSTG
jgi:hypothetical protein